MQKRKLEELNLLDDFLFNKMVSHPEFGEEFSRDLLRIILGKEVGKLRVIPQKVFYGSNTETHGARLDVYLEETSDALENATIYDAEVESDTKNESTKILARRNRFYHSKIDVGNLKAGQDYTSLKNVVIIFIMSKDPFGENRMIYTIANRCLELPHLPYDDGARTLFLYTRGTEGNPKEELQELLRYMENSSEENAKSETIKKIHHMTKRVKGSEEVSIEYMKIYERERMIKEQGFDEGVEAGRREGVEVGRREGRNEGRREGIEVGLRNFIDVCRELGCSKAEIAEKLKEKFQLTEKEIEESMELYCEE